MFKLLYLTIFLSILTIGSTLPTQDLKKNSIFRRSRRMLNGTNASITEIPSQVGLLYEKEGLLRYGGAGSIISNVWVVTVAHCTCWTASGDDVMQYISSGSSEYDGGEIQAIMDIKCHPEYEFDRALQVTYNDIALLRVTKPFKFDNTRSPIRLFGRSSLLEATAVAYGWGSVRRNGTGVSLDLKKISVEITPMERCQTFLSYVYKNVPPINHGQLCATGLSNGFICYGDSGGSLVQNGKLLGLISWIYSDQCGVSLYPGVFVDMRAFRGWISQATRDPYPPLFLSD